MSAVLLAAFVAVLGGLASGAWFGLIRRRKVETELGIQTLANLKWRDCIGVVLEALHRDGYERSTVSQAPAGGATEVMLTREGRDVLLDYKHGTAYHLTDANVRDFVNDISINGAREGILVTLGSIGAGAASVASTHNVQLIDGQTLWPKVRHYLPSSLFEGVCDQAAAMTRKGLWTGALVSLALGGLVYVVVGDPIGSKAPVSVAASEVPAMPASASVLRSDAALVARINATAKALEEIARMNPEQLATRRAEVVKRVSDLPRVGLAAWGGAKTLVVNLERSDDEAKDNQLLEEICRLLVQNEEMRFTRVQLESPADTKGRVRWRLCE